MFKSNRVKYDIITIGGSTYDITLYPSESVVVNNENDVLRQKLLAFEYGAKIRLDKIFFGFGGGAANTAVAMASLGFKAAVLTAIGNDDIGEKIIANFKKRKVAIELVQTKKGKNSGLAAIMVGPDNDRTIFSNNEVKNNLEITAKNLKSLKSAKWIYLASLGDSWQKILEKVFNTGERSEIAWNPGQTQLAAGFSGLENFLKKTEVFIVNLDEAIQLVVSKPEFKNKNTEFLNSAKNLLPIIKNYGPRIVVITCGKDGAWAYDGKKIHCAAIVKEQKRADTTGVGDAFGSSFVAGLELFKGDIDKAMRLGILNAASVIAEPGAQNGLLSRKDLKRLKI